MTRENQELTDELIQFLDRYYRDEIGKLAQRFPDEQRSLEVSFDDIYRYDYELAEDYVDKPGQMRQYFNEALHLYDLPADINFEQNNASARVRVVDLPDEYERDISEQGSTDVISKVRRFRGQVAKHTVPKPLVKDAAFECQRCGTLNYIPQDESGGEMQQPHDCRGCEREGPFELDFGQSDLIDAQLLELQVPPEDATGGSTETMEVMVKDDLTQVASTGNRIVANCEVVANVQKKNGKPTQMLDIHGEAESIQIEDTDWSDANVEEHKDRVLELADRDDIFDLCIGSIKPSHKGDELVKFALLLQMFQGVEKHLPDGSRKLGTIHVLLIGDPGSDKSGLLQYAKRLTPGAVYTDGSGSTKAGLTASAVQSDFGGDSGWKINGGTLVQAHNSLGAIDELDDMDEDDRGGMKECMSEGTISVSKADKNPTLPAYTSVLSAANPKYGRYDSYEPIGDQINLHPAVISRFDLIFPIKDVPNPEDDRDLASHLTGLHRVGQKLKNGQELTEEERNTAEPPIKPEVMRAYVAYARENYDPVLTPEAEQYIEDNYVAVRSKGDDEDSPIPTTARSIESVISLAEASARIRLSDKIELQDAKRVVDVWLHCMREIGIDPETGEFDADVIETGQSKTQRDRVKVIKSIIEELEGQRARGALIEEVVETAEEQGISEKNALDEIDKIKRQGDAYQPSDEHIRVT